MVKLVVVEGEVFGKFVIEVKGILKIYGECVIVKDFFICIQCGDCIGLVGLNGVGKMIFLKMLIGEFVFDIGIVWLGINLEMVMFDQKWEKFNFDDSLVLVLIGGCGDMVVIGDDIKYVMFYMKDFLFMFEQVCILVGVLFGGEWV